MVPHANASVAHMEIRQPALRIVGLAVFENIAHTSQRPNKGSTPIRVYLPAKTVDVYIDDVGIGLYPHTPDLVEDHGACDNAARISAQIFQKNELLRRQIQDFCHSAEASRLSRSSSRSSTRRRVASATEEPFFASPDCAVVQAVRQARMAWSGNRRHPVRALAHGHPPNALLKG